MLLPRILIRRHGIMGCSFTLVHVFLGLHAYPSPSGCEAELSSGRSHTVPFPISKRDRAVRDTGPSPI